MFSNKYVIGFGGSCLDLHLKSKKAAILRDSNPAFAFSSPGGVVRNILDNLSRLGQSCVLFSAVGKDGFGKSILDSCKMDVSKIFIDEKLPTALYFSFLDRDGDMLIAANAMDIMENIPKYYLEEQREIIQGSFAAVLDSNPSKERIIQFVKLCKEIPIFADPVSVSKAEKFLPILKDLYLLKPNRYELSFLSGMDCKDKKDIEKASRKILDTGCFSLAVSLGKEGCYYANRNNESFFASLKEAEEIVNASGAGDAFMAGIISGFCENLSKEAMVKRALACGKLAVLSEETINPLMSIENIAKYC